MNSEHSILVIDDEAVVCESFTRILSNEGYKVDTKISPQEGLDLAVSKNYNLVFLDLKMEEMDGIDLFHKLREKEPNLPVIVVTGYPSMDTALECIKLHASDYIIKPFTPDDILKLTKQIIPEVSPLSIDVEGKLTEMTAFQEWQPSGKILFHETAWMQQGKDGSVRVGGQLPNFITKNIMDLMLPKVNDITYPGLPLAGVVLSDKSRIMIPSPLSGKIIDVNYELVANPSIIKENSFDECWIARIEPADIEKDLQATQMRNVTLLCKSLDEVKGYLPRLTDLGCIVSCEYTVHKAVSTLIKEKNKVIFIDAASLSDNGPEYVKIINQEIPEAKVVVIGKPDSELEETFRKNKILYYCVSSLFDKEITDILYSVFTSKQEDEVFESCQISIIPQSIRRVHITNKHGKKVTLLVFGDLLYNNKDIGYILINKLIEKSFPIEVARGINHSHPDDSTGRQIIANGKEKNDLIITLLAKDNDKIPGQIHKEVEIYTNSFGSDARIINFVIQPNNDKTERLIFNNMTTKAVAELLFNEMTSKA
jgi:CheY-like chemotaxis protein/glycine cleavage system H lipoate-binding protein